MITGINHVTLSVRVLEESFWFYTQILGLRPVAKWPKGAYLLAGDVWVALTLDPHVRKQALPGYSHIAFTVSAADFDAMRQQIIACGTPIWQENQTEGASLYFTDPNGHKLEIHASDLRSRLQAAEARPWEGLELFPLETS